MLKMVIVFTTLPFIQKIWASNRMQSDHPTQCVLVFLCSYSCL
jgi:hypothetical protein